jgi:hypothetical protein
VHHLYFRRSANDKPLRVLRFERSACVHWSPTGDFFALTSDAGSNLSDVEIVSSENLVERVRVLDLLPAAAKALVSQAFLQRFFEVRSWDGGGIVVRVHGTLMAEEARFDLQVRCRNETGHWSCSTA